MTANSVSPKHFSVDARTVLMLGRQSIKDHVTALIELVKNSYDADATVVEIQLMSKPHPPYIRVADNGIGMTETEVDENWLRIGYSEKRSQTISQRKRRRTGEKGIGRISADRLGAVLELRTRAANQAAYGLCVSWDRFDIEGTDLTDVPIEVLTDATFTIPRPTGGRAGNAGTELLIRGLRQEWTVADVQQLHEELSVFSPPFDRVEDFEIQLKNDLTASLSGVVESPFYATAEIELRASLELDKVAYEIVSRDGPSKSKKVRGNLTWNDIVQRSGEQLGPRGGDPRLGPAKVTLLFYPRKAALLKGTKFRLRDLREFLDRNGGVKVYRDRVRVRPYGDPDSSDGDWLGLAERRTREPAGVSRATYKIAANQLVGAIFIGRDSNVSLTDSASREGMIHDESFHDFRAFVLGALTLLEAHRHEQYSKGKEKEGAEPTDPKSEIVELRDQLLTLGGDLAVIKRELPNGAASRPLLRALDQVALATGRIESAQTALDQVMTQAGVLRGLATIGIATSVFGHETQSSLSEFVAATYAAQHLLSRSPPDLVQAQAELAKAIKHAQRVTAWGVFSLTRVRRDKRRQTMVRVDTIVREVVQGLRGAMSGAGVSLDLQLQVVNARVFPMDIEALVVNLLTNAYVACQQRRRRDIIVELFPEEVEKRAGFSLRVSDSGPGISRALHKKIWQPLFTTRRDAKGKEVGTGLGLGIVDSIVREMGGEREIASHPQLKGASVQLWFPSR